jgi:hypothetical protein
VELGVDEGVAHGVSSLEGSSRTVRPTRRMKPPS